MRRVSFKEENKGGCWGTWPGKLRDNFTASCQHKWLSANRKWAAKWTKASSFRMVHSHWAMLRICFIYTNNSNCKWLQTMYYSSMPGRPKAWAASSIAGHGLIRHEVRCRAWSLVRGSTRATRLAKRCVGLHGEEMSRECSFQWGMWGDLVLVDVRSD